MNTSQLNNKPVSLLQSAVNVVWPYLGGKKGLIALALAISAAGLALNWDWLVAAGIAPLLITVLPCVVMCGVGVCCMGKGNDKACSPEQNNDDETQK